MAGADLQDVWQAVNVDELVPHMPSVEIKKLGNFANSRFLKTLDQENIFNFLRK